MSNKIRLKMVKSMIRRTKQQQACVMGLGLKRIGQVVELDDSAAVRGMYNKVSFMVKLLENDKCN